MNSNEYNVVISQLIPTTFNNIYIIDMMSDLVMEYGFENNLFMLKNTIPFTTFYADLENNIHPQDIKGYVDSISSTFLQENLNKGFEHIRYEYRLRLESGEYDWYSNVTKLINVNGKKLTLVLVENINENIASEDTSKYELELVQAQQKNIIDVVSSAIVKLTNVININAGTTNLEIKSLIEYINQVLVELTNSFPEITKNLTESMIRSTNQGTEKTLVIVDDDPVTCKLLTKTFEDTYKILVASNGQEAIELLEKNNSVTSTQETNKIVGMFLDLNMPVVDGFGVLDYMSSKNLLSKMPVIIISGDYDQQTKDRAYLYRIADVLEKPFNVQVVKHRINTFVKLYKTNNSLNEVVLTQHQDIKNVVRTMVKSYLYDNSTDVKKVSTYVNILTKQLTIDYPEYKIDEIRIKKITDASKFYNIGMYTLPSKMLEKQEFTGEENKIIKGHPFIGLSIFNSVLYKGTDSIFNHYAKDIIEYHEEHYDGTGYPYGYKGDKLPIAPQIVSVAIEYNELTKKMNEDLVLEEIVKQSGTKFNPHVVESLKKCISELRNVK